MAKKTSVPVIPPDEKTKTTYLWDLVETGPDHYVVESEKKEDEVITSRNGEVMSVLTRRRARRLGEKIYRTGDDLERRYGQILCSAATFDK